MAQPPARADALPERPEADPGFRVWIADLHGYFEGAWRVSRTIDDVRAGATGEFDGEIRFEPDGEGLRAEERGVLRYAGRYEGEGLRRYLWRFPRPGQARVLFSDGRFFHRAVFRNGRATVTHHCGMDAYRGLYALRDGEAWTLDWRVTGPRKDYLSTTSFFRSA